MSMVLIEQISGIFYIYSMFKCQNLTIFDAVIIWRKSVSLGCVKNIMLHIYYLFRLYNAILFSYILTSLS